MAPDDADITFRRIIDKERQPSLVRLGFVVSIYGYKLHPRTSI